jgi:tetratricopeptide (TPR) repeat protein
MPTLQDRYDEAMFDFSAGNYDAAIAQLRAILAEDPTHFDAQFSLGMAYCRKSDFATAIAEGHKAERLRPDEPLVHTNLSLFYMKAGDKAKAEHHGLKARIASWKTAGAPPAEGSAEAELQVARPTPPPLKVPDMPWKKKRPVGGSAATSSSTG